MRKFLAVLLSASMLLMLASCSRGVISNTPQNNDENTSAQSSSSSKAEDPSATEDDENDDYFSEKTDEPNDTVSGDNANDPLIKYVGKDIEAASYIVTCEGAEYYTHVIVFESEEDYNNFNNAKKTTNGEMSAAIEQNALVDFYMEEGDSNYVNLQDGYLVRIDYDEAYLTKINLSVEDVEQKDFWFDNNDSAICSGVYFTGTDIKAGKYDLTYTDGDWGMRVVVFASKEDYLNYHKASRFTNGEESEAIEQNALSDTYIYKDDTYSIELEDGNVLLIKDNNGTMVSADGGSTANNVPDILVPAYSGVYFVGDDIAAAPYILTCTKADWSQLEVVVFETKEDYLSYHRTSRFTIGEENAAIEQNALSSFYPMVDNSCYMNLHEGMVLMINEGSGVLKSISTSWAA